MPLPLWVASTVQAIFLGRRVVSRCCRIIDRYQIQALLLKAMIFRVWLSGSALSHERGALSHELWLGDFGLVE